MFTFKSHAYFGDPFDKTMMTGTDPELDPIEFPEIPSGPLWVYGYASLMWNPGFDYEVGEVARLYGFHRAMCVWSWRYRGTQPRPGLVMGLDYGGSCIGKVFRVPSSAKRDTVAYLRDREMLTGVYQPRLCRVVNNQGKTRANALAFVVRRGHPQYAGRLDARDAAGIIRRASGERGTNREYLINTVSWLQAQDVDPGHLQAICAHL